MQNPSEIDYSQDRQYLDNLEKQGKRICSKCKHEVELKNILRYDYGQPICNNCVMEGK